MIRGRTLAAAAAACALSLALVVGGCRMASAPPPPAPPAEAEPGTTATSVPVPSDRPPAMVSLSAAAGDGQITLTWDSSGAAVELWEYRQSTDGGSTWTDWVAIAGSGAGTTRHTVAGLTNGTAYAFQVRGRAAHGDGPSSGTATATPAATPAAPPAATPPPDRNPAANMCRRTPLVRDRIVQAVPGKDACADITAADLAAIAQLHLCRQLPGSELTALKRGDFAGLVNLERLDLRPGTDREACGLTDLPDRVFRDLARLTWLELSHNHLDELRAGMFEGLDSLETLAVRAANLAALSANVFRHLPALSQLDLGENRLTQLPPRLFANAPRLTGVDLADNRLEALPPEVFRGLARLQFLTLAGNPGAPFPLTLQLEDVSDRRRTAVRVWLPAGSPFPMTVGLQATGGAVSHTSVSLNTGHVRSEPVTVTSSDGTAVTVSLTAPPMPVEPGSPSDPKQCDTPAADRVPCFTGFQVVAGDGTTFQEVLTPGRFVIRSGDGSAMAERLIESINADSTLKANLEGHVLSDSRAANAAAFRARLGLPGAGSDFSDASGLAAKLATISNIYFLRGVRGSGAGWGYAGLLSYTNWVDGVFFATTYQSGVSRSMTPFVVGVPTGTNPVATGGQNTAVWGGAVAGRDPEDVGHLSGSATLTYDFAAGELDAVFNGLAYHSGGAVASTATANISWDNLTVTDGVFGDCSGSGNCIRGRFFDDHAGTAAASVGGVFRNGTLLVAFGADLD